MIYIVQKARLDISSMKLSRLMSVDVVLKSNRLSHIFKGAIRLVKSKESIV